MDSSAVVSALWSLAKQQGLGGSTQNTVEIKPDDGNSFKVPQALLSAASSYFAKQSDGSANASVQTPGVTSQQWMLLLGQLLPAEQRPKLSLKDIWTLLPVASKFMFPSLMNSLGSSASHQLPQSQGSAEQAEAQGLPWASLADSLGLGGLKDVAARVLAPQGAGQAADASAGQGLGGVLGGVLGGALGQGGGQGQGGLGLGLGEGGGQDQGGLGLSGGLPAEEGEPMVTRSRMRVVGGNLDAE